MIFKFTKTLKAVGTSLCALIFVSSVGYAQTNVYDDVIATSPNHTSLKAALDQEGYDVILQDNMSSFTVFAPDNNAFTNLANALGTDISGLLMNPDLADILEYHVLGADVNSSLIANGQIETPLNTDNTLKLTKTSTNAVYVNHAMVNAADLSTDNGTVHSIDAVLLPYETVVDIAIDNGYTYLTAAVATAELLPALTNPLAEYTVFAPTNDAFNDLANNLGTDINGLLGLSNLADILTYHVLDAEVASGDVSNGQIVNPMFSGNTIKMTKTSMGTVYANQAEVNIADLTSDNGTVHSITSVILPSETVVDIAIDNNFNHLTAAVIEAELLPALTNPFDTVTVFAPTDQAFEDLATALNTDVNGILALPNLSDILLYHVVSGNIMSSDLTNGNVTMLNGDDVTIDLSSGVMVNSATVTGPDNSANNGVVHIIDEVLVPETASLIENELEASVFPTVTSDVITINFKDTDAKDIKLISTTGQVILNNSSNSSSTTIDLSNFSNGTYVLRIQSNSGLFSGRVIKR